MENSADWEQKNLINELTQGMELAKQLQIHLNVTTSPHDTRELLVHKILNSYDKALSMLKLNGETLPTAAAMGMAESPHSEDSDKDFKDHEHKNVSKKRKSMVRWTKQVQVCPGPGLEGCLDDGYNWRKYGQKDILGAKYPRGYYRCTHRNVQGCLATKQIQRSDEDPTLYEITYRGRHTCTLITAPSAAAALPDKQEEPNMSQQNYQQQSREIQFNFQTELDSSTRDQSIPSLYLPCSVSNVMVKNYVDSASMVDNNFVGNLYHPLLVSPSTSAATQMGSFVGDWNQTVKASESEQLMEIVSAASATNSSTVGLDFPFGALDLFDPTFSFENPPFF
ncbi:hypothetical protein CsSME_00001882 [Camellia sinensis var. sinensis]